MLTNLATFLHAHGRRVLLVAVIGAAIAGAFGFGVAKHMSPYGADDPATQAVQATHRFEAAAGRQIDPGIVALVSAGDVHSAAAQRRVEQVAGRLRTQPDVASAVSFYETHDPAMVSRDRRLDLRGRVLQAAVRHGTARTPRNGSKISSPASTTCGSAASRSRTLRPTPRSAMTSRVPSCSRSRSSSCCRCCSSARLSRRLLPPLLGGLAIVATFFVLRIVASFADLSVFALNFVTGLGLGLAIDYSLFMVSRYREEAAARASASRRCGARFRPPGGRSCSAR